MMPHRAFANSDNLYLEVYFKGNSNISTQNYLVAYYELMKEFKGNTLFQIHQTSPFLKQ